MKRARRRGAEEFKILVDGVMDYAIFTSSTGMARDRDSEARRCLAARGLQGR